MIDTKLAVLVLASMTIIGTIVLAQAVLGERIVEPFSEIGLLGPNRQIGDYPQEVGIDQPFNLYIFVGNQEGKTNFYQVRVKIGDNSSFIDEETAMEGQQIATYEQVLSHGQNWTYPIELKIGREGDFLRLVFELWLFDDESGQFNYSGKWNQIWLTVNATGVS